MTCGSSFELNDEVQAVIALPESGIRNAADLRGKRLGLPRRVNDPIDFWRASEFAFPFGASDGRSHRRRRRVRRSAGREPLRG